MAGDKFEAVCRLITIQRRVVGFARIIKDQIGDPDGLEATFKSSHFLSLLDRVISAHSQDEEEKALSAAQAYVTESVKHYLGYGPVYMEYLESRTIPKFEKYLKIRSLRERYNFNKMPDVYVADLAELKTEIRNMLSSPPDIRTDAYVSHVEACVERIEAAQNIGVEIEAHIKNLEKLRSDSSSLRIRIGLGIGGIVIAAIFGYINLR